MARVFLTDADLVEENADLRARLENAEAALRTLVLANGHTYGCQCPDAQCTLRRVALGAAGEEQDR